MSRVVLMDNWLFDLIPILKRLCILAILLVQSCGGCDCDKMFAFLIKNTPWMQNMTYHVVLGAHPMKY